MTTPKREAELKSDFRDAVMKIIPGAVTVLHSSAGAPDRAYTFAGKTTYVEFKHGTPDFDSPGLQELTCMKLEAAGSCVYVVWQENLVEPRTLIVRPRNVHFRKSWDLPAIVTFAGFDHSSVVQWLRRLHGV